MARPEIGFNTLLGGFVLLWLGAGLLLFEYSLLVMRLPILAGLFTIAACTAIAVRSAKTIPDSPPPAAERFDNSRLLRLLALISILPLAYLLGYRLGLPVFLGIYLAMNGLGWLRSLLAAAVCAALIELLFVRALKLTLPSLLGA